VRALILGGSGIIAHALVQAAPAGAQLLLGWHVQQPVLPAVALRQCDLTDAGAVVRLLRETRPDVVIDAAGMSGVDACEKDPAAARASNVTATANLLAALREYPAKLIYVSTNAVYDGKRAPYHEESPQEPVNVYGRMKKECEDLVRAAAPAGWAIARLILVLGWSPPWSRLNPLPWMVQTLRAGKPLSLVNDVFENPLPAPFAATVLWQLATTDFSGELNVAGGEIVNRYELGRQVAAAFGLNAALLRPVPSSFFPAIAPRPANTAYDTAKLRQLPGLTPPPLAAALAALQRQDGKHGFSVSVR